MPGVWVWAETHELTLELLNPGQQLAAEMGAQLTAVVQEEPRPASDYFAYGADEVFVLPTLPADQPLEGYVSTLAEVARQEEPEVILIGGTLRGKDLAARLAARLNTGLVSGCTAMHLDQADNRLVMERLIYGGLALQTVVCTTRPHLATIPARTFAPAERQEGKKGTIRELPVPAPSLVQVRERRPKERTAVDLSEAKVIVCAGRGIEKVEDLALARELAAVLGGELACTRPLAEDLGWMPVDSYIGISGQRVKPELYIGLGVSGQIHHLSGLRDARIICAINHDEQAPIFEAADYGLVGDWKTVVTGLIQEFKTALK